METEQNTSGITQLLICPSRDVVNDNIRPASELGFRISATVWSIEMAVQNEFFQQLLLQLPLLLLGLHGTLSLLELTIYLNK